MGRLIDIDYAALGPWKLLDAAGCWDRYSHNVTDTQCMLIFREGNCPLWFGMLTRPERKWTIQWEPSAASLWYRSARRWIHGWRMDGVTAWLRQDWCKNTHKFNNNAHKFEDTHDNKNAYNSFLIVTTFSSPSCSHLLAICTFLWLTFTSLGSAVVYFCLYSTQGSIWILVLILSFSKCSNLFLVCFWNCWVF